MAARQIILQDCAADGVITVRMEQSGKLSRGVYKLRCGRSDEVEDISANTLVLTDTNASRLHAWISYEHHRHELYDAQSTNGTFVNGRRIDSCRLQHGDKIRIGMTVLRYEVI